MAVRRTAAACALALTLLPAAAAHAHPTVIVSGKTLLRRAVPQALVLPDGTFFQIARLRERVPAAQANETVVYDVGSGAVVRHARQKPQDVVRRKGYRLPFIAVRTPKSTSFEAPKKLNASLGKADVVIVVTEAAFLSVVAR